MVACLVGDMGGWNIDGCWEEEGKGEREGEGKAW